MPSGNVISGGNEAALLGARRTLWLGDIRPGFTIKIEIRESSPARKVKGKIPSGEME